MEANGFNKSAASTPFVMTKETAEEIPAAFHPHEITSCPAAALNFLDESDKIVYYLMVSLYSVHNDRLHICTRIMRYHLKYSYELHVVRFSCSKVYVLCVQLQ